MARWLNSSNPATCWCCSGVAHDRSKLRSPISGTNNSVIRVNGQPKSVTTHNLYRTHTDRPVTRLLGLASSHIWRLTDFLEVLRLVWLAQYVSEPSARLKALWAWGYQRGGASLRAPLYCIRAPSKHETWGCRPPKHHPLSPHIWVYSKKKKKKAKKKNKKKWYTFYYGSLIYHLLRWYVFEELDIDYYT